jgi:hypothetical protein
MKLLRRALVGLSLLVSILGPARLSASVATQSQEPFCWYVGLMYVSEDEQWDVVTCIFDLEILHIETWYFRR